MNISAIEESLTQGLAPCASLNKVRDVRVLGAIGVVELKDEVNMPMLQRAFVEAGVWIRPFGKLVYVMPPYIIKKHQIETLTNVIFNVLSDEKYR